MKGDKAHAQHLENGFGSDVYISNSLIHFMLLEGEWNMRERCLIRCLKELYSWNVIMEVLMQMGEFHEGLNMFVEMKKWFVGMDTHRC